ncbi:hypothetical protein E1292_06555 [Nonomuraea deserti]|uniref:Uncharacterized protein n=2 Tax=Nonomuraea deserti TaxID=1848322 RepID=A0A4R4W605_9ACTN|nr:hypothetical protein E1292_06555 [Nonomuraea deserti]
MLAEAVRDNAEWCDLMCRAHGSPGTFTGSAWTNPVRTPLFYPDAVTLSPAATAADVLDRIDSGPGASVKDSYATLDLPGFDVLFEAQWLWRSAPGRTGISRTSTGPAARRRPVEVVGWEVVGDAATLADWERTAFSGEVNGLFPASLLGHVEILCGRIDGEIVCGSVLTASGAVAGVSNVFASGCDLDTAWAGTLAMAAELLPGRPLVGYESDPEAAVNHGFTCIGPLRVWLRP